ncbi:MAG TPA: endo-1,4-beta-xylanase [Myxococcaceae bacterium]|nr:endo-1,4-beta-xylanase [Myxococcaceae bacterium]
MMICLSGCAGVVDESVTDLPNDPFVPPAGPPGDPGGGMDGGFIVDPDSLRARVSSELTWIGTAVNTDVLRDEAPYGQNLGREFNSVTPENVMKWGIIHPEPQRWDFAAADALVAFAEEHHQAVRGHTLVWHDRLPTWVNQAMSASDLSSAIQSHIDTLVGRYRGKVKIWDVVNEAIDDSGQFRSAPFYSKLGAGYIDEAFRRARAADPDALLAYNDSNIEIANAKSDAVYALLQRMRADGVPVDVLGMQFHVRAYEFAEFHFTETKIRENIRRFVALGLKVHITELDVRLSDLNASLDEKLQYQRDIYQAIVNICRSEPGCDGVTTWGVTDKHSWIDAFYGPDDPLLFNDAYVRKPAYEGVRDGLQGLAGRGFDLGLDTACGRTLVGHPLCESFEAVTRPNSFGWYPIEDGGGTVSLSSTRYRGKQALRARTTPSANSAAFMGRGVFGGKTSGNIYARAYIYVPASITLGTGTINVMNVGETQPPYQGVAFALTGNNQVQLGLTTANQYISSAANAFKRNEWTCITMRVTAGASGSAAIAVNGAIAVSRNALDTLPAGGYGHAQAGIVYITPGHPATEVFIDEFAVSTSPLGCD